MKDISIYFQEVNDVETKYGEESLGNYIQINKGQNFPELENKGIAFFSIPEYRNNKGKEDVASHQSFRASLYNLQLGVNWEHSIYDLGIIQPGKEIKDSYHAIKTVCSELIKKDIIPIVIGGSQDLTRSIYKAYGQLEQLVNLTTIDNQLDLGDHEKDIKHDGWLSHVLLQKPCYLFNYSNIGAQTHYIPKSTLDLFNNLYFDICRLGQVNHNIETTEPILRNTDLLSVDLTSIRASDLQNENYTSPNGLFAHQACQILKYAGISDKLTSLGIFNYYGSDNKTTDELIAQLIWYFNEGYAHRKGDFPIGSKKGYTKFNVFLEDLEEEILFYKSNKSSRWWIEVPYPSSTNSKYIRHQMVPCSYETYQKTMQGEVPDLWWKTYQKFV